MSHQRFANRLPTGLPIKNSFLKNELLKFYLPTICQPLNKKLIIINHKYISSLAISLGSPKSGLSVETGWASIRVIRNLKLEASKDLTSLSWCAWCAYVRSDGTNMKRPWPAHRPLCWKKSCRGLLWAETEVCLFLQIDTAALAWTWFWTEHFWTEVWAWSWSWSWSWWSYPCTLCYQHHSTWTCICANYYYNIYLFIINYYLLNLLFIHSCLLFIYLFFIFYILYYIYNL